MQKLIHDLLDLTQIESGRKNRELATVDLRAIAQTAIDAVQPEADLRKIACDWRAPTCRAPVGRRRAKWR